MLVQKNIIVKNADIIGQRGVKPMTPDEVVEELKKMLDEPKFSFLKSQQALNSALALIQDYQKLRERVSAKKIRPLFDEFIVCGENKLSLMLSKDHSDKLADKIITYLQQPTEH